MFSSVPPSEGMQRGLARKVLYPKSTNRSHLATTPSPSQEDIFVFEGDSEFYLFEFLKPNLTDMSNEGDKYEVYKPDSPGNRYSNLFHPSKAIIREADFHSILFACNQIWWYFALILFIYKIRNFERSWFVVALTLNWLKLSLFYILKLFRILPCLLFWFYFSFNFFKIIVRSESTLYQNYQQCFSSN
jgi:hypothetical protein